MLSQSKEELDQMEEDFRTELMSLRVAQQVGGQPGKVNRIKMVRKSIARVLTVATAKRRGEAYEEVPTQCTHYIFQFLILCRACSSIWRRF